MQKYPGCDCENCPRLARPLVKPDLRKSEIIVVGQDPGFQEVYSGKPFVGPSGQLLSKMFQMCKLPSRNEISATNTALCQPANNETEKEAHKAYACCGPRVFKEIEETGATHVLLAGKAAYTNFTGKQKYFEASKGYHLVLEPDHPLAGKVVAVPVAHPVSVLRRYDNADVLFSHIKGFAERIKNPLSMQKPDLRIEWPANKVFLEGTEIAVDIETRGKLIATEARLDSIAISDGQRAYSWQYPFEPEIERFLHELFGQKRYFFIFHNGITFDIPILKNHGFKIDGIIKDTMMIERYISAVGKRSLAHCASIYTISSAWKGAYQESDKSLEAIGDYAKRLMYNAEDALRTHQVYKAQQKELIYMWRGFTTDFAHIGDRTIRQMHALAQVAAEMHVEGFPVDFEKRDELRVKLKNLADERRAEMMEVLHKELPDYELKLGKGGVNRNALRKLLFDDLKLIPTEMSETGKPGTGVNALVKLMSQDFTPPFVRAFIKSMWRYHAPLKALSTYVDSAKVENAIGKDGAVHPNHQACHALSRRFSCKNPNLYNLSEEKDAAAGSLQGDLPNIRAMYYAGPGNVIVHYDFDSLEIFLMALISGDETLYEDAMQKYRGGEDIHTLRARAFFGIPADKKVESQIRKLAKTVAFATQYGASLETVHTNVLKSFPTISLTETKAVKQAFERRYKGVVAYWHRELEFAKKNGYSLSRIMQFRMRYPVYSKMEISDVANRPIQSTAADVASIAMIGYAPWQKPRAGFVYELKEKHPQAKLIMHTYDSFDVRCPEKEAESVAEIVKRHMEGPWYIDGKEFRLYASGGIGKNWNEV